jgi:hypothetical protein
VRKQCVVLENRVHVTLERWDTRDILAVQFDLPGSRLLEPGDQAETGRLAGTRRAEHGEEFAVVDVQINVIYGFDIAKVTADIPKPDSDSCAWGCARGWTAHHRRACIHFTHVFLIITCLVIR